MKGVAIFLGGIILATECSAKALSSANEAAVAPNGARTALVIPPILPSAGKQLFQEKCAICHSDGKLYPGTVHLRQLGQPQPVLNRQTSLNANLVRQVVRHGLGTMPAQTPTQVTDANLEKIAHYLTRQN